MEQCCFLLLEVYVYMGTGMELVVHESGVCTSAGCVLTCVLYVFQGLEHQKYMFVVISNICMNF